MFDPASANHPAMDDLREATRRLDQAERARASALRAWETSDEAYPLNAAIALEAAERDLRLARKHLEALHLTLGASWTAALEGEGPEAEEDSWEKAWGGH